MYRKVINMCITPHEVQPLVLNRMHMKVIPLLLVLELIVFDGLVTLAKMVMVMLYHIGST